MWQTREVHYYTKEPQGNWRTVNEAFVRRNIKRLPEGYTKDELLDFYKNHPRQVYNAGYREYRHIAVR